MIKDIESLRFGYETDLFRIITAQLGNTPLLAHTRAKNLLDIRRTDLLGEAVRITADLLPEIHETYQSCLDILGHGFSGELFVRQSMEYNASVFAHEKKFDVLVHSALLNDFTPDELAFVFGHELGHVLFEHSRFCVFDILSNPEGVSRDTADILFRWSRASEVSADRVGLLCCGKLSTAVTALFKTASGLAGIDMDQMLRSFRRQYEDLEKQLREASDDLSWVRTHPMIPIRFKALELAALDIVALRQQSGGFSGKGFRAIDQQIAGILEAIDINAVCTRIQ
ncbi:M48 family metallopeptidase [Desulfonema magnum]|uniref:Peptidase, M48 family n=1 Tax=Desulfonema magnum TaxID=45655 RepID=A0A975GKM5_9BACT|nr:M48 family metallopeptidase [Desulfonema magnum]QTA84881.1 Peptidase, M48 family [Desulfonema magnum]